MVASTAHHFVRAVASRIVGRSAALRLRSANAIGARGRVFGAAHVENWGTLTIGGDFTFWSYPLRSHIVVEPGGRVVIGNGVMIGAGAAIASECRIEIGDGVTIGRSVIIMDTDFHDTNDKERPGASAAVVIGANARIGDNVTILKGVRLAEGARVASGSLVWTDSRGQVRCRSLDSGESRDASAIHD